MNFYALDKNKKPVRCSINHFTYSLEGERVTKKTTLKGDWKKLDIHISTVFLGLDHRFVSEGKPILWETMIFCEDEKLNNYMVRATSHKQALKNHYKVVSAIRNNHLNTL